MPQITVTINGRGYPVACDPGQEQRIRDLARMIDGKVAGFADQFRQAGEARLLVLAALMIADELAEAKEASARAKPAQATLLPANDTMLDRSEEAALAEGIERLAARIEAVAARFEASQM
jgi:cell division protein ZapA